MNNTHLWPIFVVIFEHWSYTVFWNDQRDESNQIQLIHHINDHWISFKSSPSSQSETNWSRVVADECVSSNWIELIVNDSVHYPHYHICIWFATFSICHLICVIFYLHTIRSARSRCLLPRCSCIINKTVLVVFFCFFLSFLCVAYLFQASKFVFYFCIDNWNKIDFLFDELISCWNDFDPNWKMKSIC